MTSFQGRPLYSLTVEEFVQLLDERINAAMISRKAYSASSSTNYVHGLRGIERLFNCSHKHAQYLKDNVIKDAVMQNGRKIVVDADLALKLFNERRAK